MLLPKKKQFLKNKKVKPVQKLNPKVQINLITIKIKFPKNFWVKINFPIKTSKIKNKIIINNLINKVLIKIKNKIIINNLNNKDLIKINIINLINMNNKAIIKCCQQMNLIKQEKNKYNNK